jgi:hypothetical protein
MTESANIGEFDSRHSRRSVPYTTQEILKEKGIKNAVIKNALLDITRNSYNNSDNNTLLKRR